MSMSGKADAARSKSMSSPAVGLCSDVEISLPSASDSLERQERRRFNPNAALGVLATWHGTRGGVYSPLVPDQLVVQRRTNEVVATSSFVGFTPDQSLDVGGG
jgi:hypothetical protein